MNYFGKPWPSGICDVGLQVPTPVGTPCHRCKEPMVEGDQGVIDMGGSVSHRNCFMRPITGSVAHIEGRCSCFVPGADEGDDSQLSRRDAADAAVAAWERKEWRNLGYTFALGADKHGDYILCDHCGKKSYNLYDINELYCGECHQFHDGPRLMRNTLS